MPIMGVVSAALYLPHPELHHMQGVGLLTELSAWSHVNFVSVDRFIYEEFDGQFLLVFHVTIVQTFFAAM
jgi:hypothetical protein